METFKKEIRKGKTTLLEIKMTYLEGEMTQIETTHFGASEERAQWPASVNGPSCQ